MYATVDFKLPRLHLVLGGQPLFIIFTTRLEFIHWKGNALSKYSFKHIQNLPSALLKIIAHYAAQNILRSFWKLLPKDS